jgi:hypothetical protein
MTATEHAGEFFKRLCLSDDGLGYPDRVAVVAADVGDVATHVWEAVDDEHMPIVVIDADGGETLVSPRSRPGRLLDRLLRRSRVRVETRVNGAPARRRTLDRAALERELLAA